MSRTYIEKLKDAVSEYLDTIFGGWYYDITPLTGKIKMLGSLEP